MKKEVTEVIKRIHEIEITGDVIPPSWYSHIIYTTKKGKVKPDMLAIAILANIVYWYKPRIIRDEQTNRVTGYERKFDLDKLQRSYAQLGKFYGQTKDEVKTAVRRLEDLKLITVEFRTLKINGKVHNNVMFVEPIPDSIKKINEITPYAKNSWEGYGKNLAQAPRKKIDTPLLNFPGTNTETSYTKITTKSTEREESKITYMNFSKVFYKELEKIIPLSLCKPDSNDSKVIGFHVKEEDLPMKMEDLLGIAKMQKELIERQRELDDRARSMARVHFPRYSIYELENRYKGIMTAYGQLPLRKNQTTEFKQSTISLDEFKKKYLHAHTRAEEFKSLNPTFENGVLEISGSPSEIMCRFLEYFGTYKIRDMVK